MGDSMALFFDTEWFDGKLAGAGLAKEGVARALGLSEAELAEMWKDQREISDAEIKTLGLLLGTSEAEVRKRGGVQGSPQARQKNKATSAGRITNSASRAGSDVEHRLSRIEGLLEEILKELKSGA